jgi:hypothetical protein
MSYKLIFHPLPRPSEGLYGYLLRLAEGNHLSGIKSLLGIASPTQETLDALLGTDKVPEIARLFHSLSAKNVRGVPLLWNRQTSRFCPECLKNVEIWRKEWELSLYVACHMHHCLLVDQCPSCKQSLHWQRSTLLQCPCGWRLKNTESTPADKDVLKLTALFSAKLNDEDGRFKPFKFLNIAQLHLLALLLAANTTTKVGTKSIKIDSYFNLSVAITLCNAASEILMHWPSGFHTFLKKLAQQGDSHRRRSSPKAFWQFEYFHSRLLKHFSDSEFSFVITSFEDYLENQGEISHTKRRTKFSANLRKKDVWIPVKQAASELRTPQKQIISWIESGEVRGHAETSPTGETMLSVSRNDFPVIRGILTDKIDLQTAISMLGINKRQILLLMQHDTLGSVIFDSPSSKAKGWHLSKKFLTLLLDLGECFPLLPNIDNDPTKIDLGKASTYLMRKKFLFPNLIFAVTKGGQIDPIGRTPNKVGLASWIFDEKQLRQWIADRLMGKRDDAFTLSEAAKQLGTTTRMMNHLINTMVIYPTQDMDSGKQIITKRDFDAFHAKFAFVSELANRIGMIPSLLSYHLQKTGIKARCGPSIDRAPAYLYFRSKELDDAVKLIGISCGKKN